MRLVGLLVKSLATVVDSVGGLFQRAALLLHSLLPALLSSADLRRLIRTHYDNSYRDAVARFTTDLHEWALESWEQEVLHRHGIVSGIILVLGAGIGRESLALAQRGLTVVGLDINRDALRAARHMADRLRAGATFLQADLYALPAKPGRCDFILLSGIMYSAIPGRRHRQDWVRNLGLHVKPGGLAILNFLIDRRPPTRIQRLGETINDLLVRLPGANRDYQPGDTCAQGHFLHAFRDAQEIRDEVTGAGVQLVELQWSRGFAVVRFPRHAAAGPREK